VSHFSESGGHLLVLYDGRCGLCGSAVRWLLRRDRQKRLRFAAFESARFAGLLARHGISAPAAARGPETILVVREFGRAAEAVLTRSQAVLALLAELPQPWPVVAAVLRLIPRPLRELGYRLVARWRTRIGGRMEVCLIFPPSGPVEACNLQPSPSNADKIDL
jgi:predicted DCC family thiol-disulfide oxidoreductase YuxK